MNRLEFINNIQSEDEFKNIFKSYFDELMIIYDLVGKYENINIFTNETSSTNISFDIIFNSADDSTILKYHLDTLPFVIRYKFKYNLYSNIDNNILHIQICRVP